MNCKTHGKPVAGQEEIAAYKARPKCVARKSCDCSECRKVCWDTRCGAFDALAHLADDLDHNTN